MSDDELRQAIIDAVRSVVREVAYRTFAYPDDIFVRANREGRWVNEPWARLTIDEKAETMADWCARRFEALKLEAVPDAAGH